MAKGKVGRPKKKVAPPVEENKAPEVDALKARIQELESKLAEETKGQSLAADIAEALRASRQGNIPVHDDSDVVEVVLLGSSRIAMDLQGVIPGTTKRLILGSDSRTAELTKKQLAEMKEKAPHFFSDGLVSVDGEASNPNVVISVDAFFDRSVEDIMDHIRNITSTSTLYRLLNYVSEKRLVVEGEGAAQVVVERDVDPKLLSAAAEIRRKLSALSGVTISD